MPGYLGSFPRSGINYLEWYHSAYLAPNESRKAYQFVTFRGEGTRKVLSVEQ